MTEAAEVVRAALFEKFMEYVRHHDECVLERDQAEEEERRYEAIAERAEEARLAFYNQLNEFQSVGLKLGFDLFDMMSSASTNSGHSVTAQQNEPDPEFKIKDFIIAEVRKAFPNPVRAAELRKKIEALGHEIHEKTVGMTLYRWSKKGRIRRDGIDWYYVEDLLRSEIPELHEAENAH